MNGSRIEKKKLLISFDAEIIKWDDSIRFYVD